MLGALGLGLHNHVPVTCHASPLQSPPHAPTDSVGCAPPFSCLFTPVFPQICSTVLMDYDDLAKNDSALGTGAVIVMDKSTDLIDAFTR